MKKTRVRFFLIMLGTAGIASFLFLHYNGAIPENLLNKGLAIIFGSSHSEETIQEDQLLTDASSSPDLSPESDTIIVAPPIISGTKRRSTPPKSESITIKKPSTIAGVQFLEHSSSPASSTSDQPLALSTSTITVPPSACTTTTFVGPLSRNILLNEIAWMGSPPATGETASDAGKKEWIELKNNSDIAIDLFGWQLADRSGKLKLKFDEHAFLASGHFFLVARASTTFPFTPQRFYSGGLVNSGDSLQLLDDSCRISDELDASSGWPAGNNETKQTLERDRTGFGWHTSISPGGTPGAENSMPVPAAVASTVPLPASAQTSTNVPSPAIGAPPGATATTTTVEATTTVVSASSTSTSNNIQSGNGSSTLHVMIAGVQIGGASSTNDFIKLYNPFAIRIDIGGWKLRKRTKTGTETSLREFPASSSIDPGQYFVWANAAGDFAVSIGANISSTETLAVANSIALFDTSSTLIDALAWGSGTGQFGEGAPYPVDPDPGQVLARKIVNGAMLDTDNNATDFAL